MVKCPYCEKEISESFKKCPYCKKILPKDNESDSNESFDSKQNVPKKTNSSNKLIAVIAIVAIIAIVGVLASGMFSSDNSTTDVKSESDTVDPITEDDDASSQSTEYWASAKAEKFHLPTCEWAEKISDDNKIVYHSRDDAIADGKVPCGVCNP